MKKLIFIIISSFALTFCGIKQPKAERIFEDGVEVVINHLEPYQINGEPKSFELIEE